jgi:hypothetical protein
MGLGGKTYMVFVQTYMVFVPQRCWCAIMDGYYQEGPSKGQDNRRYE